MSISFTTTHGQLTSALALMKALLGNRPTFPAAGLIRLLVSKRQGVSVDVYNGETYVHWKLLQLQADDDGLPGEVLVRRGELETVLKALSVGSTKAKLASEPLQVVDQGGTLRLTGGGYTFTVEVVKDEEMVPPPPIEMDELVFVQRDEMLSAVTRLEVCAGRDLTLPMLTGINMKSGPGGITMAATDRFRLGVTQVPVAVMQEFKIDRLIPAMLLSGACRLLPVGEELQLGISDQHVWLMSFGATVAVRPLDVEFVKYQSLIPQASPNGYRDVVVTRTDLLSAMRRARLISDRGHHARISLEGDKLEVTAGGKHAMWMQSPKFTAEPQGPEDPLVIAFNPEYLAPALDSFSTDRVAIRYSTPARPFLLAEPGHLDDETSFRTLIMPARLPG